MGSLSILVAINFLFLSLFLAITIAHRKESTTDALIPRLYYSPKVSRCSKDSPEVYYDEFGWKNIESLLEEGKVFFGVLMDKLEFTVSDTEEQEKLTEEWESLSKIILQNFDLAVGRIQQLWEKIIVDFDTKPLLPWELSWSKAILVEQFIRLHYEYQILEAVLKSGVKEIVSSLQTQLVNVIKSMETNVLNNAEDMTEKKLLASMEGNLKKLKPNFVTTLLTAVVHRAMDKENRKDTIPALAVFVEESLERITLVVEAYKNKGDEFPNFWAQMTTIMKNDGRKPMSVADMLTIYADDELVIHNIIRLLTKNMK